MSYTDVRWRDDAACAGRDLEWFYPTAKRQEAYKAKALEICGGCPVRDRCLEEVLRDHPRDRHGVWGGRYFSDRT